MNAAQRWRYYRRIFSAYLGSRPSHLAFWHETPALNLRAFSGDGARGVPCSLGEYYMLFREKADYIGPYDSSGIPLLDYRGAIGPQYNPIAIAQWGLANYNQFCATREEGRRQKALAAADWLCHNLDRNPYGLWVWNHHFNWDYRNTLRAPWYSGLAQGQGISLLLRTHALAGHAQHRDAAERAFVSLTKPISDGGLLCEDEEENLWIEEYLVDPPTHILNGFIWALWGVFDFWLAIHEDTARDIFERGVNTLLGNLSRYDTGYWSLYEQRGRGLRMLASPFYHELHIVQLRVMARLSGEQEFAKVAERWENYTTHQTNRTRALVEKSIFKLLYY